MLFSYIPITTNANIYGTQTKNLLLVMPSVAFDWMVSPMLYYGISLYKQLRSVINDLIPFERLGMARRSPDYVVL